MGKARGRSVFLVALATLGLAVVLYPGALLRGEAFFERDLPRRLVPAARRALSLPLARRLALLGPA
jgi:hypothetical protein